MGSRPLPLLTLTLMQIARPPRRTCCSRMRRLRAGWTRSYRCCTMAARRPMGPGAESTRRGRTRSRRIRRQTCTRHHHHRSPHCTLQRRQASTRAWLHYCVRAPQCRHVPLQAHCRRISPLPHARLARWRRCSRCSRRVLHRAARTTTNRRCCTGAHAGATWARSTPCSPPGSSPWTHTTAGTARRSPGPSSTAMATPRARCSPPARLCALVPRPSAAT
mmetsp:Transcript_10158/g.42146  ORF Transcript_10158/g.42146 Transcript_10158/m.42146 type:complete len:219 (+) Transcript_10158:1877-2533(+)